jgi:hypothetical protein
MSPDFPKRSDRKFLERIIPPPLGGRDELHFVRSTTALRTWYNSSNKLQSQMTFRLYTSFPTLGSHYQRVSLKVDLPGIIPSKLSKIHILFSETPVSESETGWSNYPAQRGFESNLVL